MASTSNFRVDGRLHDFILEDRIPKRTQPSHRLINRVGSAHTCAMGRAAGGNDHRALVDVAGQPWLVVRMFHERMKIPVCGQTKESEQSPSDTDISVCLENVKNVPITHHHLIFFLMCCM